MEVVELGVAVAKIDYFQDNKRSDVLLPEPKFYKELSILGKQHNIHVFVFSAEELDQNNKSLFGFCYTDKGWKRQYVPFPDVVFDRCFYASSKERIQMESALIFIRRQKPFQLINNNLPSKIQVYDQLNTEEPLIPYLPHTDSIQSISEISHWLELYPQGIILKPAAGMHGKGVIHIYYNPDLKLYLISGRNLRNDSFEISFSRELSLLKWLYKFKKQLQYVVQPYFYLRNDKGQPFDIRVLLQKDDNGQWQQTGSVARVGRQDGLTSNLHGGGETGLPLPLLSQNLGSYKAERLLQEIHMISGQTVIAIEQHFGRFGELALDFGVTPQGRVWLLECNSKPGRQAFTNDLERIHPQLAIERPLQYAKFLYQHYRYRQHAVM
ncbi:MAG: YheC/YheD family protein [Candidatus Pristimantibacillus lignocellulolyticus]|uniref:YheC/YheD family protein n=1 Tax=Candidatus Pristimantibacillus lignocellulolyticus TaxID=2994561 RepID=A0A9J6ZAD8_9BACL|nr:MAG: YheC/YheD family protein [Candidatus Pristimantibacillus lignocellulolyticus]